jgi:hypothetical protein
MMPAKAKAETDEPPMRVPPWVFAFPGEGRHHFEERQMKFTDRRLVDFEDDVSLAKDLGDPEDMLIVLEKLKYLQRWAREIRGRMEGALIEHIEASGKDVIYGTQRYYTGKETKVKRLSPHADILKAILKKVGGDIDQLGACIA